jgi:cell wall-associated NlpC family hydrolase
VLADLKYGICNLSIIPARKEPSDSSEMVTQFLFGELVEILARKENWLCVKSYSDNYECWIDHKQINPIYPEIFELLCEAKKSIVTDLISVVKNEETGMLFPISAGATLFNYNGNLARMNGFNYVYEGEWRSWENKGNRKHLVDSAYLFLNTPYLWGGKSPFGIDCSGFTQLVYKMNGYAISRDARQQAEQGKALNFIEEAKEGDLAFFDNNEGKIIHVGIVLSGNKIIHASGKVRIDTFDHQGIYNIELEKYTHRLRIIKNLL